MQNSLFANVCLISRARWSNLARHIQPSAHSLSFRSLLELIFFFPELCCHANKVQKAQQTEEEVKDGLCPSFPFSSTDIIVRKLFCIVRDRLLRAALRSRIDACHNAQCNFHAFGSWLFHEPTAFAFRFMPTLCYDESVAVNRLLRCGDGNCATACIPGHIPVLVGAAGHHTLDTHTKKTKKKKDSWMLHVRRQRLDCEMKPAQWERRNGPTVHAPCTDSDPWLRPLGGAYWVASAEKENELFNLLYNWSVNVCCFFYICFTLSFTSSFSGLLPNVRWDWIRQK